MSILEKMSVDPPLIFNNIIKITMVILISIENIISKISISQCEILKSHCEFNLPRFHGNK
mgnify:CR=1 FL=1